MKSHPCVNFPYTRLEKHLGEMERSLGEGWGERL